MWRDIIARLRRDEGVAQREEMEKGEKVVSLDTLVFYILLFFSRPPPLFEVAVPSPTVSF